VSAAGGGHQDAGHWAGVYGVAVGGGRQAEDGSTAAGGG